MREPGTVLDRPASGCPSKKRKLARLATVFALAVGISAAFAARLAHPALHTDEITYMNSTLESMIQGRVFPVKGDGAFFVNKPPLSLWLMRLSFELLGPSPFAARLPSVLTAAATAVVLYLFGALAFGEGAGLLAALIFVLTPGLSLLHGVRSATPDGLEILLVTSAIAGLEVWRRRRRPWALAGLVACVAASAWVKSPFALIVFLTYLFATEPTARRAGQGAPRLGATIAVVLGVWLGAYGLWLGVLGAATSPRAVKRLLVQQYVRRIEGRLGKSHLAGPGFYLASARRDFGPLLLLPAGAAAAWRLASRRGWRLSRHDAACLVAWSLAAPVLATVSANKLAWYAYLSYPGIALLLAVSARCLAQGASGRRSARLALWAVPVLVLAWRMPVDHLWPAQAQYRDLTGRFWEIASRDPRVAVFPGPGFRFSCSGDDVCREARFFIRTLFWKQSRSPAGPGSCRAVLINHPIDTGVPGEVVELHRPIGQGAGLFLLDGCDGRLRERLYLARLRAARPALPRRGGPGDSLAQR